jgi:hypothetical protein
MTSLSGQFTTFSKVVICAMMIRGRHRGLPYAVDRAVILPGDSQRQSQESTSAGDYRENDAQSKMGENDSRLRRAKSA